MNSGNFVEKLGYLFYVASPNKTSFETPEEVPDYTLQAFPHFALFILLEHCLLIYKKRPTLRLNDAYGSIAQGLFLELTKLVVWDVQLASYAYIYNNWRLATLPWDSPWTWWFCFLGVDFCYYWLHRGSHEINILWASHQVHHSSEDYNLGTALRQSAVQNYCVWIFNLPLAVAIPPSVFLVHTQFNLLFQFWLHTEAVTTLGPLEFVFNTASHHRVHHGRNRYCIDKNYGGVLIIWDRLFGTFEPEKEEVIYGLTHPVNSFELFYVQFFHYVHIWRTFWTTKGLWNKLSVIFKGPGWSPGTPWHGYIEDIPEVKAPIEKYDPPLAFWCKLYTFLHILILAAQYAVIAENNQSLSQQFLWGFVIYEVFSMSILGMLMEGRLYAQWLELPRCLLYLVMDYSVLTYIASTTLQLQFSLLLRSIFVCSFIFWLQYCLRTVTVKTYSNKLKKDR